MLKKNKISGIKMLSDEWYTTRLAKFTSSDASRLVGRMDTLIRYVREKVGEEMTGKSANGDVDIEATRWGLFHEADACTKFGQSKGLSFLVTQQLISDPNERLGSTPDGLIVKRESPDGTEYEVETIEVKCPPTFANYIGLFECDTPTDLKAEEPKYYWQVLDQMDICQSLVGHFVVYHPDFKAGNFKTFVISKDYSVTNEKGKKEFPVYQDLKFLRERKAIALEMFDKVRTKLILAGHF